MCIADVVRNYSKKGSRLNKTPWLNAGNYTMIDNRATA